MNIYTATGSKSRQVAHENFKLLSDSELYKRAQEYGLQSKQWLRKFEGLLPEIYRRRLYKRRGFASVHEFAAKLAGMSHEKVNRILRLATHLEDKPTLKTIFESGAVNYSKIEKVVYVATAKNEGLWAEKVVTLPQPALELCVRAARKDPPEGHGSWPNSGLEVTPRGNSQPEKMTSIKINMELEIKLRFIKQKLEKGRGETLALAEVINELVRSYEEKAQHKEADHKKTIQLCPKCIKKKANEIAEYGLTTRHIPQEIQDFVVTRQQGHCAFPECHKPGEIFHHTRRFALDQNHDPDYLFYLCTPHERLAHAGLIENEEDNSRKWGIREQPDYQSKKWQIDERVGAYRHEKANP